MWLVHILFLSDVSNVFLSPFFWSIFKLYWWKKNKYYKKRRTTWDNDNVQSNDQEESKLNSNIMLNSDAHTFTDDKIIQSPFSENNEATY